MIARARARLSKHQKFICLKHTELNQNQRQSFNIQAPIKIIHIGGAHLSSALEVSQNPPPPKKKERKK